MAMKWDPTKIIDYGEVVRLADAPTGVVLRIIGAPIPGTSGWDKGKVVKRLIHWGSSSVPFQSVFIFWEDGNVTSGIWNCNQTVVATGEKIPVTFE